MRLRSAVPIAGLFLLLLGSGCVQRLSASDRQLCLDLSSKSYAFVPECDTEQQCFSALESGLFNFDSTVFSGNVQSELYFAKNDAALSWLFFNKARENIKEINEICNGGKSLGLLPEQLNRAMSNLQKAFELAGSADNKGIAILLIERSELMQQDINLIKEEPLFNDFAAISNNLGQLASQESCSGDTFACFYLREMQRLNELMESTGFSVEFVQETPQYAVVGDYRSDIEKTFGFVFKIPFIGTAFSRFISYLSGSVDLEDSMEKMRRLPAFEFLQSYNQLMGQNNSALQKFSAIMKSDALNRAAVQQRSAKLQQDVSAQLDSAEQSLDSLLSRQYASFDENFLAELYAVLGQDSAMAAQQYSIQDMSQLEQEGRAELLELQSRFNGLVYLDFIGQLSMGRKAFELKELSIGAFSLQQNLDYLSSEAVNGLLVLCNERIDAIGTQIEKAAMPADNAAHFLQAADLKARTEYKIKQFSAAKSDNEKLLLCRDAVAEFNRFSLSLSDFQEVQLQSAANTGECLSSLSAIFGTGSSGIDLSDFSLRYKQLQGIQQPYDDSASVERLCSALLQDVESFLGNNASLQGIEDDFAAASALMQPMRSINARDSGIVSRQALASSESQFNHFSAFFSEGNLILPTALPVLDELRQQLHEFVLQLRETVREAIVSFAEKNASISVEQGQENGSSATIAASFANPFYKLDEPLELRVPFRQSVGSLIYASESVQSVKGENGSLVVELSSFPIGQAMLGFSTAGIVEISESTKLLSASGDEAIFQKTISIKCAQPLPLLQVRVSLVDSNDFSYKDISVSAAGRMPEATLQGNTVSFMLQNCSSVHSATVLFTVLQPIMFSTRLLETAVDGNSRLFTYEITVKNRLPLAELRNIDLTLSLQSDVKSIKSIELLDAEGKAAKFSLLPGKEIAFSVESLLPLQGVSFFLGILAANTGSNPLEQPVASLAGADQNAISGSAKQAADQAEQIKSIESAIESAEATLAELEALFSAVTEKELIDAKYTPPISRADLSKLGLSLNKLKSELSKKSVLDFISLSEQGDFEAAMLKAASFNGTLPELLQEAESANSQLASALDAIKEDAFASFNSAADLFNNAGGSGEAQQLLEEAKAAYDSKQYLSAVANARKATALLLQSGGTGMAGFGSDIGIPTFIYPLIAAAGLVLFVRFKKQKIRAQKTEQIKRIARNW